MERNQEEHRVLISALVHAIPDRDAGWAAYRDDPEFRALVRTLADLWIDLSMTLIEKSRDRRDAIALAIAAAEHGTLDLDRFRELYERQVPPPEPHYVQVRRSKPSPRGIGRIRIHVEHPPECRRKPHTGTSLGRFNCGVEEAADRIKVAPDPELGRFRVDEITAAGFLSLTPVPPLPGHRFQVSYGSQRAFVEIIHPPACAGPGKCVLEDASLPSPHPHEGDYGLEGVTPEGVLVLNDHRPLPAPPPPSSLAAMTWPTEDER